MLELLKRRASQLRTEWNGEEYIDIGGENTATNLDKIKISQSDNRKIDIGDNTSSPPLETPILKPLKATGIHKKDKSSTITKGDQKSPGTKAERKQYEQLGLVDVIEIPLVKAMSMDQITQNIAISDESNIVSSAYTFDFRKSEQKEKVVKEKKKNDDLPNAHKLEDKKVEEVAKPKPDEQKPKFDFRKK